MSETRYPICPCDMSKETLGSDRCDTNMCPGAKNAVPEYLRKKMQALEETCNACSSKQCSFFCETYLEKQKYTALIAENKRPHVK